MSNFLPLYPYCMSYFLCYFLYIISTSPCGWKILELDIIQYTSIHPSFILFYVYMWQDYQKFWSLDFGVLPTFEVVNLSHYQLRCHIEGISVYLFWIYVQLLSCFFFFLLCIKLPDLYIDNFEYPLQPLVNRLEDYTDDSSLTSKRPNLVSFPPDFEPIPCRPLFFDLALNHIDFPSLEEHLEQKQKTANTRGLTGFVKGWLWGGSK